MSAARVSAALRRAGLAAAGSCSWRTVFPVPAARSLLSERFKRSINNLRRQSGLSQQGDRDKEFVADGARDAVETARQELDGRATFHFGNRVREGEPHIVWRRIGTHKIFTRP
jgi:hypothetical protein